MTSENSSAASRLCVQCGMCCNGALFQSVALQPGDSAQEITAGGPNVERQKGVAFFRQPCSALRLGRCTIYAQRPTKCREFVCRQIQMLEAGETTEREALQTIERAVVLHGRMDDLLKAAGNDDVRSPIGTRYLRVTQDAVDLRAMRDRAKLMVVAEEFAALLESEFQSSEEEG